MDIILTGSGAVNTIPSHPHLAAQITSVQMAIPNDDAGTADYYVTASGAITGSNEFHDSIDADVRYKVEEQIDLTAVNFVDGVSAVIKCVYVGDDTLHQNAQASRPGLIGNALRKQAGQI